VLSISKLSSDSSLKASLNFRRTFSICFFIIQIKSPA
jgi:hypothetical protein